MSLITPQEIASVLKFSQSNILGKFIGNLFLQITKLSKLNKIYDRVKHEKNLPFIERLLDDLGVDFEVSEKDLQKIPKYGAFITISNHPLGGIDGLVLLKILMHCRADYKIIANFLLHRVSPLKPYIFPVNPFENHKDAKSSLGGIKMALAHLKKGSPLGIFPAGEVSTFRHGQQIVDKPWEKGAVRLIKKATVPVIPVYFDAKNSSFFYFLSRLNPILRTVKLPSEILNQKNKKIKIRIGNPISVEEQKKYKDLNAYRGFLRKRTFVLHHMLQAQNEKKTKKKPLPIAPNVDKKLLIQDIDKLGENDRILETEVYDLYFVKYEQIPHIIKEIGVVREHTFRSVGEGTQNEIDLDKYDIFYRHLFLWDKNNEAIVGGYRLGLGDEIFEKYGKKGFYLNDFFEFKKGSKDILCTSIEMGRAFVTPAYQRKNVPLLLLLKGIFNTGKRHPNLTKLVGSVSVSRYFSNFSKSLMIGFFNHYFKDEYLFKNIKTRKKYQVPFIEKNIGFILESTNGDIDKLEEEILALDSDKIKGIPTLFKRYLQLNSKVIGFAVDPDFNDCLDILMYVNFNDLPTDGFLKNT